jgi:hypothetical protein
MNKAEELLKLLKVAEDYDEIGMFNNSDLLNIKISQIIPSLSDSTYDLSNHLVRWKDVAYDFQNADFLRNKHYRDKIPTYKDLGDDDPRFKGIEESLHGDADVPGPASVFEDGFTLSNPGLHISSGDDLQDWTAESIEKENKNKGYTKYLPWR